MQVQRMAWFTLVIYRMIMFRLMPIIVAKSIIKIILMNDSGVFDVSYYDFREPELFIKKMNIL